MGETVLTPDEFARIIRHYNKTQLVPLVDDNAYLRFHGLYRAVSDMHNTLCLMREYYDDEKDDG